MTCVPAQSYYLGTIRRWASSKPLLFSLLSFLNETQNEQPFKQTTVLCEAGHVATETPAKCTTVNIILSCCPLLLLNITKLIYMLMASK